MADQSHPYNKINVSGDPLNWNKLRDSHTP